MDGSEAGARPCCGLRYGPIQKSTVEPTREPHSKVRDGGRRALSRSSQRRGRLQLWRIPGFYYGTHIWKSLIFLELWSRRVGYHAILPPSMYPHMVVALTAATLGRRLKVDLRNVTGLQTKVGISPFRSHTPQRAATSHAPFHKRNWSRKRTFDAIHRNERDQPSGSCSPRCDMGGGPSACSCANRFLKVLAIGWCRHPGQGDATEAHDCDRPTRPDLTPLEWWPGSVRARPRDALTVSTGRRLDLTGRQTCMVYCLRHPLDVAGHIAGALRCLGTPRSYLYRRARRMTNKALSFRSRAGRRIHPRKRTSRISSILPNAFGRK